MRSTRTLEADQRFRALQSAYPSLARFTDPGSLVAYLTSRGGDLDEKDRVLATLVECVQRREQWALATALLWLGLWPALDAIYRRRLRSYGGAHSELVSAIAHSFSTLLARIDLRRTRRVAATLVRSTERDVAAERKNAWRQEAHVEPYADLEDVPFASRPFGEPSAHAPAEDDLAALRRRLEALVGEDADLLLSVLLLGESQREAGEKRGLRHEATRKRVQRALQRLREHFRPSVSRMKGRGAFDIRHARRAGGRDVTPR